MENGKINKVGEIAFTKNILANGTTYKEHDKTQKATALGRVKFTTMLRPDLKEYLEIIARGNGLSIADVLEFLIEENLKK